MAAGVHIRIDPQVHDQGKAFLAFLSNVGRKYPVRLRYRSRGVGHFYVTFAGRSTAIDALFQELILNRGLYYYASSLHGRDKKSVLSKSVIPIYQDLLESRFTNPYSRVVRRHVTGKLGMGQFVPGDLSDVDAHEYEVLYRKWGIGVLDDWNFIKDLDSFLNHFMLTKIAHVPGRRSPNFARLTGMAQAAGLGVADETLELFVAIHTARTQGLHRLQSSLSHDGLSSIAGQIYNYFQFYEEFVEAQTTPTERLHGRRYRRIKYGSERWTDSEGRPVDWGSYASRPCHDCEALRGQFHVEACDMEQCPRCQSQRLGCDCKLDSDYGASG